MKVEDSEHNSGRCIRPTCPTYSDCMRDKDLWLFCSRGRTDREPSAKGCLCGECPVWSEHRLGSYYFCKEGVAV